MYDPDFRRIVFESQTLVSVSVLYYLPDHRSLVNEFLWQTLDVSPSYPRVHRFLKFWRKEIDAKIKEVIVAEISPELNQKWRHGIVLDLD